MLCLGMICERTSWPPKTRYVPRRRIDLLRRPIEPLTLGAKGTFARDRTMRTVSAQICAQVPLQVTSFQSFANSSKRVRNSLIRRNFKTLCFHTHAHSSAACPLVSILSQKHTRGVYPTPHSSGLRITGRYTKRKEYKLDLMHCGAQTTDLGRPKNAPDAH
jgi:hypothetical protein